MSSVISGRLPRRIDWFVANEEKVSSELASVPKRDRFRIIFDALIAKPEGEEIAFEYIDGVGAVAGPRKDRAIVRFDVHSNPKESWDSIISEHVPKTVEEFSANEQISFIRHGDLEWKEQVKGVEITVFLPYSPLSKDASATLLTIIDLCKSTFPEIKREKSTMEVHHSVRHGEKWDATHSLDDTLLKNSIAEAKKARAERGTLAKDSKAQAKRARTNA